MSTNCTYLDEKHCNIVLDSGLTRLVLSIDGANKETYEKIRVRADFEEVTENARRFLQMREERGAEFPRVRMQIIRMKETEAEIEQFRQQWQPLLRPTDVMYIKKFTDFGGQVADRSVRQQWSEWKNMTVNVPSVCGLTYFALGIHYNGDVVACCFDVHGEMTLGNVMNQSLEEIWHGPAMQEIRDAHLSRRLEKFPLCAKCDEIQRDVALPDLAKEDAKRVVHSLNFIKRSHS
jgi:radical SAM protein with 4Fe4S-binding SPASM domain